MDERRGQDPPEPVDVARVQPVAVRWLESSVLITSTTHMNATNPTAAADRRAGSGRAWPGMADSLLGRSRLTRELAGDDWVAICTAWQSRGLPDRCAAQPSRAASASASATSVRSRSDGLKTYSDGVWAPSPRGPSPSTVSGMPAAKWLASLAPPRERGHDRPAQPLCRAPQQPLGRPFGVHRRPEPLKTASSVTSPMLRRHRREHRLERAARSLGTHVEHELAGGRHDVDRVTGGMIVGTTVRRSGPSGSSRPATLERRLGERQQRVRAEVRRAIPSALSGRWRGLGACSRALRRTTTPSSPSSERSPASKHRQAS